MKRFLLNCIGFLLLLLLCSIALWKYARIVKKDAYLLARLDKHEILNNASSPKAIFVGGSNLAFGIDCSQIADSIGFQCVNMGLHAGQGMRFIMNDLDPYIKNMNKDEGNIIILMPEFAHFFGDVSNGDETTLGEVFLVDPSSISLMSKEQKILIFKGIPKQLTGAIMESIIHRSKDSDFKYKRYNFDDEGDEVSHLVMKYDNTRTPIPPHIILKDNINKEFLQFFKKMIDEWGKHAIVLFLPETIYDGYIEDNREKLDILERELRALGIPYYAQVDAFSYPYDLIFKAPDHITGEAVIENSSRIGHILKPYVSPQYP